MPFTESNLSLIYTATKLNIGCGHDYRPGWLNIDMDPACRPDVLLVDNDFSGLPKNRYDYAYIASIIEHIPRQFVMGALLEWANLVKIDGEMYVDTSDPLKLAKHMEAEKTFAKHHNWFQMMFGNQAHAGDFHYNGFTDITLTVHLAAAGLVAGDYSYIDDWVICTTATKVEDWATLANQKMPDDQFIEEAYRYSVLRDVDPNGRAHYANYLANGGSRREMLKTLCSSNERLYKLGERLGF